MLNNRTAHVLLGTIVVSFLILGVLYALNTPPWQAPDEPAHYNYIHHMATRGCCPVIEPSDWDQVELESLKAAGFPDNADISGITYEDWQPPLYYALSAVFFNASQGDLFVLRLISLVYGAGVVSATYTVIARLFPRHTILAVTAAAFVAFIPQHIAILASINNDALSELQLAMLIAVAIGYVGNPTFFDYDKKIQPYDESMRPHAAAMGGFLGLIFLTKLTPVLPAVVIILLAIAWRWRIEGRSLEWLIQQLGWGIGIGALIGFPWWLRNEWVYGFPDLLGMTAHSNAVTGQALTADFIAQNGDMAYITKAATDTYRSFFGQFGWMGVPMQPRDYWLIGVFLVWALIGLVLLNTRFADLWKLVPQQRAGIWILIASMLATVLVYVYYNLTFLQLQGRYLFNILIPLSMMVAAGGWGWVLFLRQWLRGPVAKRALTYLPFASILWMPLLALWALVNYLIPWLD
jgi:4-amino-4-deoxy-L-arabinose transferase-like glycosyltransferase